MDVVVHNQGGFVRSMNAMNKMIMKPIDVQSPIKTFDGTFFRMCLWCEKILNSKEIIEIISQFRDIISLKSINF